MQRTKSKILSILLSLVMLLSLLPTTALAAGIPDPTAVFVDGGKSFYNNRLYYKSGDKDKEFTGDKDNYIAHYDPATGTLTLNGYKGGSISVGGAINYTDITVVLKGTNTINGSLENAVGGDITITTSTPDSEGTLKITREASNDETLTGIETGLSTSYSTGNVTIEGNAKVTISVTNKNSTINCANAYGIFAKQNITISENASVNITCATPNNTTGGSNCNGMFANGNVSIDTNGTIKIDVTNAGKDDGYSFGVYPMGTATLTKVSNMEVQWKKHATHTSYPGGAIKGGGSFDTNTHAVNEDTTNCYASYRKGTPYTVTVVNGDLAGPGVFPYAKNDGEFLAGDTVKIRPSEKKSNDGTPIPFKEWTAEGVKFDSPAATASNSFTVPGKDVTVTAMHSPFVGTPVFKSTSSSSGTIEFKTVANPDNSEFFQYVKNGETTYNGIYPQPTTTSTKSPYAYSVSVSTYYVGDIKYLEAGEYRMAVTLNGERYLSDPFKVNYTESTTNISVSGTIKSYGSASDAVTVTLTPTAGGTPLTTPPTGASGSAPYSQNYTFSAVPAGTYTLKVEKKGHAPWTENITVGTDNITGKDVTIYLIGDVNGDGAISVSDMQRLYAHLNGTKPLTDTSTADVNNDKVISVSDMQRLYAHLNGTKPLSW